MSLVPKASGILTTPIPSSATLVSSGSPLSNSSGKNTTVSTAPTTVDNTSPYNSVDHVIKTLINPGRKKPLLVIKDALKALKSGALVLDKEGKKKLQDHPNKNVQRFLEKALKLLPPDDLCPTAKTTKQTGFGDTLTKQMVSHYKASSIITTPAAFNAVTKRMDDKPASFTQEKPGIIVFGVNHLVDLSNAKYEKAIVYLTRFHNIAYYENPYSSINSFHMKNIDSLPEIRSFSENVKKAIKECEAGRLEEKELKELISVRDQAIVTFFSKESSSLNPGAIIIGKDHASAVAEALKSSGKRVHHLELRNDDDTEEKSEVTVSAEGALVPIEASTNQADTLIKSLSLPSLSPSLRLLANLADAYNKYGIEGGNPGQVLRIYKQLLKGSDSPLLPIVNKAIVVNDETDTLRRSQELENLLKTFEFQKITEKDLQKEYIFKHLKPLQPFLENRINELETLEMGDYLLWPVGFLSPANNHAMVVRIDRQENNRFFFKIYNQGLTHLDTRKLDGTRQILSSFLKKGFLIDFTANTITPADKASEALDQFISTIFTPYLYSSDHNSKEIIPYLTDLSDALVQPQKSGNCFKYSWELAFIDVLSEKPRTELELRFHLSVLIPFSKKKSLSFYEGNVVKAHLRTIQPLIQQAKELSLNKEIYQSIHLFLIQFANRITSTSTITTYPVSFSVLPSKTVPQSIQASIWKYMQPETGLGSTIDTTTQIPIIHFDKLNPLLSVKAFKSNFNHGINKYIHSMPSLHASFATFILSLPSPNDPYWETLPDKSTFAQDLASIAIHRYYLDSRSPFTHLFKNEYGLNQAKNDGVFDELTTPEKYLFDYQMFLQTNILHTKTLLILDKIARNDQLTRQSMAEFGIKDTFFKRSQLNKRYPIDSPLYLAVLKDCITYISIINKGKTSNHKYFYNQINTAFFNVNVDEFKKTDDNILFSKLYSTFRTTPHETTPDLFINLLTNSSLGAAYQLWFFYESGVFFTSGESLNKKFEKASFYSLSGVIKVTTGTDSHNAFEIKPPLFNHLIPFNHASFRDHASNYMSKPYKMEENRILTFDGRGEIYSNPSLLNRNQHIPIKDISFSNIQNKYLLFRLFELLHIENDVFIRQTLDLLHQHLDVILNDAIFLEIVEQALFSPLSSDKLPSSKHFLNELQQIPSTTTSVLVLLNSGLELLAFYPKQCKNLANFLHFSAKCIKMLQNARPKETTIPLLEFRKNVRSYMTDTWQYWKTEELPDLRLAYADVVMANMPKEGSPAHLDCLKDIWKAFALNEQAIAQTPTKLLRQLRVRQQRLYSATEEVWLMPLFKDGQLRNYVCTNVVNVLTGKSLETLHWQQHDDMRLFYVEGDASATFKRFVIGVELHQLTFQQNGLEQKALPELIRQHPVYHHYIHDKDSHSIIPGSYTISDVTFDSYDIGPFTFASTRTSELEKLPREARIFYRNSGDPVFVQTNENITLLGISDQWRWFEIDMLQNDQTVPFQALSRFYHLWQSDTFLVCIPQTPNLPSLRLNISSDRINYSDTEVLNAKNEPIGWLVPSDSTDSLDPAFMDTLTRIDDLSHFFIASDFDRKVITFISNPRLGLSFSLKEGRYECDQNPGLFIALDQMKRFSRLTENFLSLQDDKGQSYLLFFDRTYKIGHHFSQNPSIDSLSTVGTFIYKLSEDGTPIFHDQSRLSKFHLVIAALAARDYSLAQNVLNACPPGPIDEKEKTMLKAFFEDPKLDKAPECIAITNRLSSFLGPLFDVQEYFGREPFSPFNLKWNLEQIASVLTGQYQHITNYKNPFQIQNDRMYFISTQPPEHFLEPLSAIQTYFTKTIRPIAVRPFPISSIDPHSSTPWANASRTDLIQSALKIETVAFNEYMSHEVTTYKLTDADALMRSLLDLKKEVSFKKSQVWEMILPIIRYTNDSDAGKRYTEELATGLRQTPTITQLLVAFLKGNGFTHLHPLLKLRQQIKLTNLLAEFFFLKHQEKWIKQALNTSDDKTLSSLVFAQRHYDWHSPLSALFLAFEALHGFVLRPRQIAMIEEMVSHGFDQHIILQAIMGDGKTTGVIPIVSVAIAQQDKLVFAVVDERQFRESSERLHEIWSKMGIHSDIFVFKRGIHDENLDRLKLLYDKLNLMKRFGYPLVTTPESLNSMRESLVEYMKTLSPVAISAGSDDQLRKLNDIYQMIVDASKIVDEADATLLDPLRELKFPIGIRKQLPDCYFTELLPVLDPLYSDAFSPILEAGISSGKVKATFHEDTKKLKYLQVLDLSFYDSKVAPFIRDQVIAQLRFEGVSVELLPILSDYLSGPVLNPTLTPDRLQDLFKQTDEIARTQPKLMDRLAIIKDYLLLTLRHALQKEQRKDIGIKAIKEVDEEGHVKLKRVSKDGKVVPLLSLDEVRGLDTELEDRPLTLLYTLMAYRAEGLERVQLSHLISTMQRIIEKEERETGQPHMHLRKRYTNWAKGTGLVADIMMVETKNEESLDQLVTAFEFHDDVINYFVRYYIPIEVQEEELNAMGLPPGPTVGMSGTLPLGSSYYTVKGSSLELSKMLYLVSKPQNMVIHTLSATTKLAMIEELKTKSLEEHFSVFIDAGGKFVDITAQELGEALLSNPDFVETYGHFVFIADAGPHKGRYMVMSPDHKIEVMNRERLPKNRYTYFSHGDTRGKDIPVDAYASALISGSLDISYSNLFQSIFRLRQLENGQHFNLWLTALERQHIARDLGKSVEDLTLADYLLWIHVETTKNKEQLIFLQKLQEIHGVVREKGLDLSRFSHCLTAAACKEAVASNVDSNSEITYANSKHYLQTRPTREVFETLVTSLKRSYSHILTEKELSKIDDIVAQGLKVLPETWTMDSSRNLDQQTTVQVTDATTSAKVDSTGGGSVQSQQLAASKLSAKKPISSTGWMKDIPVIDDDTHKFITPFSKHFNCFGFDSSSSFLSNLRFSMDVYRTTHGVTPMKQEAYKAPHFILLERTDKGLFSLVLTLEEAAVIKSKFLESKPIFRQIALLSQEQWEIPYLASDTFKMDELLSPPAQNIRAALMLIDGQTNPPKAFRPVIKRLIEENKSAWKLFIDTHLDRHYRTSEYPDSWLESLFI